MAKQKAKGQSAASRRASKGRSIPGRAHKQAPARVSKPWRPPQRSTYIEAVALYERGIEALQKHDYAEAIRLLGSVLEQFPEERELAERVRLYLTICERQSSPREDSPATIDERLYAATLALNSGHVNEALRHLRLVRDEDPDNDHALYMLAVAHAQRGEHLEAVAHLARAIALNPENRSLARQDPDLDPLRDDEAFQAALEPSLDQGENDNNRPDQTRTGR